MAGLSVSPVNASMHTSRCATHDSGSRRFATPFLYWTCTNYHLPVCAGAHPNYFIDPNYFIVLAAPDQKSWVNMYRIHEVIEADVGSENALKRQCWGSAQDLKRFKHSANSVTVGGDSARHGKEVEQPPKHPMSVDEAADYLNYVLQSWLSSKGA